MQGLPDSADWDRVALQDLPDPTYWDRVSSSTEDSVLAAPAADIISPSPEAPSAENDAPGITAPAAASKLTECEAKTNRTLLISWKPGTGCRRRSTVTGESAYHVVMIHEGVAERIRDLPTDRWSYVLDHQ